MSKKPDSDSSPLDEEQLRKNVLDEMDLNLELDPNDLVTRPPANSHQLEKLKSDLAEAEKRVLLAQADLENFRRRMRKETQDQIKYASMPLITEILDSVDNLNRAIESQEQDVNGQALIEGTRMVAQQLSQTLQNHGCRKIEAVGQPFDPAHHQAVHMQLSSEFPPNTVIAELRPGFMLHDRVLRPAQVSVSRRDEG